MAPKPPMQKEWRPKLTAALKKMEAGLAENGVCGESVCCVSVCVVFVGTLLFVAQVDVEGG